MFRRNYLLDHIRQDGRNTLIFCLCFAAAGLLPWLAMERTSENAALRFAGATAVVMAVLGTSIAAGPALNPKAHHTIQDLQRYGPIDQVLDELQADFHKATNYSRLSLGPEWLTARGVGVTVLRREEITRVELGETQVRSNGVGVGSNWRLDVTTRDGRTVEFPCRNQEIALQVLAQLSPGQ
jgi:hypothetical protein